MNFIFSSEKENIISYRIMLMIKKRIKFFFEFMENKIFLQKLKAFRNIRNYTIFSEDDKIEILSKKEKKETNINSIYLLNKISLNINNIFRIFKNSTISIKEKYFNKWKKITNSAKEIENLNGEIERKISSKYENKLKEYEKKIKHFDNEYKELKICVDNFEIKQKQLSSRVSEMQEKEKEYLFKSKNILEEKKINLEKLKELKAEISQKCIKIENYIRDLDNILLSEKDNKKDKEAFVNSYINEMNSLLDFYEKKSSKFFFIILLTIR